MNTKDELKLMELIPPNAGIVFNGDDARQIGYRCRDCNSKDVVYLITEPHPPAWDAGAYCYKHLLARCRKANMVPTPMPTDIFDKLKADLSRKRSILYFFRDKN